MPAAPLQIRVSCDFSQFKTGPDYYRWEEDLSGTADEAAAREQALDEWLKRRGIVECYCSSDDLLYFRGPVNQVWDYDKHDGGWQACDVKGYESNGGASRDVHYALEGVDDKGPCGLLLSARFGGAPLSTGWRLAIGMLSDKEGMPMRVPAIEMMPETHGHPVLNTRLKTYAHRDMKARIWMRDVIVRTATPEPLP